MYNLSATKKLIRDRVQGSNASGAISGSGVGASPVQLVVGPYWLRVSRPDGEARFDPHLIAFG